MLVIMSHISWSPIRFHNVRRKTWWKKCSSQFVLQYKRSFRLNGSSENVHLVWKFSGKIVNFSATIKIFLFPIATNCPLHPSSKQTWKVISSEALMKSSARVSSSLLVGPSCPLPPKTPPDSPGAARGSHPPAPTGSTRWSPQGASRVVLAGGGLAVSGLHTATRKIRLLKGRKAEI